MSDTLTNLKNKLFGKYTKKDIPVLIFYTLIFYGVILNILYAYLPPNFFMPDEIYQSLEVAHKFVYGYGIISWEWGVNTFTINGQSYGPIRSLITPLIFSIFFMIGDFLHLNYWNVILPSIREIMIINFMIGLYYASKIIKELSPDKLVYADKIFLIVALFYHETLLYGSKTLTNTIVISFVFIALYYWIKAIKSSNEKPNANKDFLPGSSSESFKTNYSVRSFYESFKTNFFAHSNLKGELIEFLGGICVGIAIWMRPDVAVVMGIFVLLYIEKIQLNKAINFALGFLISAIFDGLLDLFYYGKFFETFFNFLSFNLTNQSFFGTEPFGYYFSTLVQGQQTFWYLFVLTIVVIITMILGVLFSYYKKTLNIILLKELIFELKLFLWVIIVLIWWETQPHKELRFMVIWEMSFLVMGAYTIALTAKYLKKLIELLFNKSKNRHIQRIKRLNEKNGIALFMILVVLISVPFFVYNAHESTQIPWNNFRDVLYASTWVGQQSNVTGVGILMPLWYDGGYTFLHRNVTIYNIGNPYDVYSVYTGVNGTNYINYTHMNTSFVPAILAYQRLINYLIAPRYQYYQKGNKYLQSNITSSGYKLVATVYGSCDIYYL